jgi:RNA polymerase sigma factor (sigma-70 family)
MEEETSFEEFQKNYANLVRKIILSLKNCTPEDREDLSQDIWLSVWSSWERFDHNRPTAWIHRIATNRIRDEYRKRMVRGMMQSLDRREEDSDFLPSEMIVDTTFETTYAPIYNGERELFNRWMASLTQKQKLVVALRAQGYKYVEISKIFGTDKRNLYDMIRKAGEKMKTLRAYLDHLD